MIILCDTSSILLLLRIAPDMFIDQKYECITIPEIFNEIFRTQKFKGKYPWRTAFKSKVKPLTYSSYKTSSYDELHKTIQRILDACVPDSSSGQQFYLSPEDHALAACAIAKDCELSSGDTKLVAFLQQQFPDMFKGNLTALEVINRWLENKVLNWDDAKHAIVGDWKQKKEASQPASAVKQFKKLTEREYPGS
jgi:hypothetical protein